MSAILRTVEFLLRQQHAVRKSHRPWVDEVSVTVKTGSGVSSHKTSPGDCIETPRSRGLLLGIIRELLDETVEEESKAEYIRLHPPGSIIKYRKGDKIPEFSGRMDPVVGPKRAHGRVGDFFERDPKRGDIIGRYEDGRPLYRGDYMSRTDRKD